MTTPTNQQAYAPNTGTATIGALTFHPRDPSSNDIRFPLYQGWVNTITKAIWYLEEFSSSSGAVLAQWRAVGPIVVKTIAPTSADYTYPIGQTWVNTTTGDYYGLVGISGTTATWSLLASGSGDVQEIEVDTFTGPGSNPVTPVGSIITITGAQVASGTVGTNVIRTDSVAAGEITIEVQRSTTAASPTVADNGVSHFNSADFTVDSDGFVSSIGGGFTRLIEVDTFSGPGTDPVAPTAGGVITVTGGQVAAGTTTNAIRTNSLAANTYTIQVQRAAAEATPTVGSNGIAHFSSDHFAVDSNGFVTLVGGGLAVDSFLVNSGTPSPVVPDSGGQITLQGSGSITVVGSTNTMTPQLTGLTDHAVLVGAGTDTITKVAPSASSGIPFVSKGSSADPSFDTADVIGGGTGVTSFTSFAPVCGGLTSTGDLQSADSGIATAGFVLTSTGASSLPTWQSNASGAGIEQIDGNSGNISASTVTINGGTTGLTTTCATNVMSLGGTLIVDNGGTGVNTMTTAYAPVCAGTTATGALQVASTGLSTSGFVLTSNGSSALPSFQVAPGADGFTTVSVQTFDTPGTPTYTAPANLKFAIVEIVGGGGGGGGSGTAFSAAGGGGAGGYSYQIFSGATIGASQSLTIGAGGTGGAGGGGGSGGTGNTGGQTLFGALLTANGGAGGVGGPIDGGGVFNASGGAGGTASGGLININGQAGGGGISVPADWTMSGAGGTSFFGQGGASTVTNSPGNAGTGYGSGGSGSSGVGGGGGNITGASGAPGFCKVTEFI